MDKKPLSERDICTKFITPAIQQAGWDSHKQVREEVNYFGQYQGAARQVLEALLDKYADTGIESIEDIKILQLDPFSRIGAPIELVKAFGGKVGYTKALHELEEQLYG
jgi:type I site-specific restriction endonuclease